MGNNGAFFGVLTGVFSQSVQEYQRELRWAVIDKALMAYRRQTGSWEFVERSPCFLEAVFWLGCYMSASHARDFFRVDLPRVAEADILRGGTGLTSLKPLAASF